MKFLGMDYGDAHVGLAVGDDAARMALPLQTIHNKGVDALATDIKRLTALEEIDVIVIGVPQLGSIFGEQRSKIENVMKRLQQEISLPIHASDESFSSRQAHALMRDTSPSPGTDEHAIAAMLILQGYFDSLPTERKP